MVINEFLFNEKATPETVQLFFQYLSRLEIAELSIKETTTLLGLFD